MLKKIAVTGGLASGKSTVCKIFRDLGAHVVSADEIVHNLLSSKTALGQQVIDLIGNDVVVNGQIDRSKIAKKVFNNRALLQSLQNILHPAVGVEIEKQYQQVKTEGHVELFVAEIPLLFEGGKKGNFDATVAVVADSESSRQRFMASTGYDKEEYDKRMAQQLSPEEKAKRADYVINNRGTLQQLQQTVIKLYKSLTSVE